MVKVGVKRKSQKACTKCENFGGWKSKFFQKRGNRENFGRSRRHFSETEGKSEKRGEMHHCLRGDGRPCYHMNSAPFLYLYHRHCQPQDIIFILLLYPSRPGLALKIKMASLQILLPWPIWSFTYSIWTTPTLTATLPPPGILQIRPELLLTPNLEKTFDSSQRSWISW